jgi:diaminopimelate decarboxylase
MDQNVGFTGHLETRLEMDTLLKMETPCYVFDPATVISTYSRLRALLGTPLVVSLKANPNIDLLVRCAHAFSDGIELASMGELDIVVGRTATQKFVNSPAIDMPLLEASVASRATVILDNPHQVELAATFARRSATPPRFVLRVNAASIAAEAVGRANADHFGMDVEGLLAAAESLTQSGAEIRGLHVFAGSFTFDSCSPVLADRAEDLINAVESKLRKPLEFINLGGGIPDDWDGADQKFAEYGRRIAPLKERLTVMHEAGRAVFGRGGVFATKVMAVKRLNRRQIVICDGGLAHCFMLAQTEKVLKKLRRPRVMHLAATPTPAVDDPILFVGNSCNRADVIGELPGGGPLPQIGDLVLFDRCGAYHTYTPTNFLQLKSPRFYLVS